MSTNMGNGSSAPLSVTEPLGTSVAISVNEDSNGLPHTLGDVVQL